MSERFLSAAIYKDSMTPSISAECAIAGFEIVKEIAPWIRIERENRVVGLGSYDKEFVLTDRITWPKRQSDISIVLTSRAIAESDELEPNGNYSLKRIAPGAQKVGQAFHMTRVNSKRIAIVNARGIRRPEHTVAHEVGHLLGVQLRSETLHCEDKSCLMFPMQFPYGKANRTFCDCCSEQLHENSLKLRRAKSGLLGFARNSTIF